MSYSILVLWTLIQAATPPQPVSEATFVGTWVGLQSWATEALTPGTTPGVQEAQTVTLTIELIDGKITGTLNPFFGGSDGATIIDAQVVGEELKASAIVGRPSSGARGGRGGAGWKSETKIQFTLKADRTRMTGTADVELSGLKWMRYKYDLEKKRSRY